ARPGRLLRMEDYVDLATIRCFDRVTTARVPAPQRRPDRRVRPRGRGVAYEGSPQRALQALLDLPDPSPQPDPYQGVSRRS
ncbi:MAG: hypothetical protein ACRDSH_13005, partial [Pseudonocardiaceae bacterium]